MRELHISMQQTSKLLKQINIWAKKLHKFEFFLKFWNYVPFREIALWDQISDLVKGWEQ